METMSRMDDSSRMKLAKVMGKVSNNYSIAPYIYIDEIEFRNSIYKKHSIEPVDIRKK